MKATFISRLDRSAYNPGVTKVEDQIYVLDRSPNRIKVYEDQIGFRYITDIVLSGTNSPYDIVYSDETKSVYISDTSLRDGCIWVMSTLGGNRLTKWLTNVTYPFTLSLSSEGHHLLVLRGLTFRQLEIYTLRASLVRRLQLPPEIQSLHHVVQTSAGNFIIAHQLNDEAGPWVMSQLTYGGQVINRFLPRNKSQALNQPHHMSLDLENSRLFVADYWNNRVILFDSSNLTWSQVLVSKEKHGIREPFRLFYDASKKHLFVAQLFGNVTVFEIS